MIAKRPLSPRHRHMANRGRARTCLFFTIDRSCFDEIERDVEVGLMLLTGNEGIEALAATDGDRFRVPIELTKAMIRWFDGQRICTPEERDSIWATVGSRARNLLVAGHFQMSAARKRRRITAPKNESGSWRCVALLTAFLQAAETEPHELIEQIYDGVAYAMRYSKGGLTARAALAMEQGELAALNNALERLVERESNSGKTKDSDVEVLTVDDDG